MRSGEGGTLRNYKCRAPSGGSSELVLRQAAPVSTIVFFAPVAAIEDSSSLSFLVRELCTASQTKAELIRFNRVLIFLKGSSNGHT